MAVNTRHVAGSPEEKHHFATLEDRLSNVLPVRLRYSNHQLQSIQDKSSPYTTSASRGARILPQLVASSWLHFQVTRCNLFLPALGDKERCAVAKRREEKILARHANQECLGWLAESTSLEKYLKYLYLCCH